MTGMICRKSMMPCQTPGMCSPHGGCPATEQVSSAWLAQLRSEYLVFGEQATALKAENARLHDQVKALQSVRALDARLAGFWRSPKETPPEGVSLVVLRDAGAVANGAHPGSRAGRWLELTSFQGRIFICDVLSTGNVIGWVGVDEFKGLKAMCRDVERYQVLRQADVDTIHNGGLFAGLTPDNIVINGHHLDERTDAVIDARKAPANE